MPGEIVVLITAPSRQEARTISRRLVGEKLAACVNIVPRVESVFFWEGRIRAARECLLVVKTRGALFNRLAARVRTLHSYTVPEIIALPVRRGSKDYLQWVRKSTR